MFSKLGLPPALAEAIAARGYEQAMPVQVAVMEASNRDRDLLVSSQTGSGKTLAFGALLARVLLVGDCAQSSEGGDAKAGKHARAQRKAKPTAGLVIAPTRELANQVCAELTWLFARAPVRVAAFTGGSDIRRDLKILHAGVDLVVGTPGRLVDLLTRGALQLEAVESAVLDEADEMLDMGFREDLEFILDAAPEDRRTLMFSATMPKSIAALAKKYQRNALRIEVTGDVGGHADIEYRAVRVEPKETEKAVINLLRFYDSPTALVFCNTRDSVRHLQATLQERGFAAAVLSGELSQHERNLSMQALRDGRARVCVATDVAARGLDLPSLGLVIHAELPHDAEALQHRSGRTGRAGRKGVSVLLVPHKSRRRAESLIAGAKVEVEWAAPPSAEEIRQLDRRRLLQEPLLNEEPTDEDSEIAALLLSELGADKIATALARVLRARLPEAEDVVDPGFAPERRGPREFDPGPPGKGARSHKEPMPDAVWFRLDIGRTKNADPKWLLPMLCRKGGLNRADIGAIRIFPTDTKVEIASSAAGSFLKNMRRPGPDQITVERVDGGGDAEPPKKPKPKKKDKPKTA